MSNLDKRLILTEWIFSKFGFADTRTGMKQFSDILKNVETGWDAQEVFHFRRHLELSLPATREVTNDMLIDYDRNIFRHWFAITQKRIVKEHRDIYPLYFQYMSLLFTEYYLDRWSRDIQQRETTLLDELNEFKTVFNRELPARGDNIPAVTEFVTEDLSKLAYWIATGGGKTLIMHCNIKQLDYYIRERKIERHFNKYILITPNEGLTDQHIEEFEASGIAARRYEQNSASTYDKAIIEVIEITKLKEKSGVTTVAVAQFGRNNIVMVDEGHRGAGGDEWFSKRQQLCLKGFSFEYSATFGQSVNALNGTRQTEMRELYSKSIIFDYSYKYFFGDGYGKDFHILNFSHDNTAAQEQMHKLYLTACILRFYQQCKLYRENHAVYATYLIDDPLMVFVGGSVTGQKDYGMRDGNRVIKEDNRQDTDVVSALRFFGEFIADETASIARLDLLIRGRDDLHDGDELVFRNAFSYITSLYPRINNSSARNLFQDILRVVFNSEGRGTLHAVYLIGSGNEIGLRIGDTGKYFGVINVGEPKKLWNMLQAGGDESIVCSEQQFSVSLFDSIKNHNSSIRLLIGAKKFTEGWNCWRVSSMGLINVGRSEGSQIIQLFGRGVRLKGLDFSLKRSDVLHGVNHPDYIRELETLNIFGVRADYMEEFDRIINDEDIASTKNVETFKLPTIENLARTDLKLIVPKKNMPDFKKEITPQFKLMNNKRLKVTADWYGRLESRTKRFDLHSHEENTFQSFHLKTENTKFLDYDRLYIDLLKFKKQNAMYNLEITRESIQGMFSTGNNDWYELYIPAYLLEFTSFDRVELWQEIAADLLKRYCRKYYDYCKDEFESPYQELRTIAEIVNDPEEKYNAQVLQSLRVEYEAAIDRSKTQLISELKTLGENIKKGRLQDYAVNEISVFRFDKHLYQPLIHIRQGVLGVSIKPVSLNQHEKQFLDDLKAYCESESTGFFKDRELYILRNQSKGKGISFFEEGNFYPDFIIWLLHDNKQYITFADPHGLQYARSLTDAKIQFHKHIKEIEKDRLKDKTVVLNSFILSPTRFNQISHWSDKDNKDKFYENHVLFMYDDPDTYIGKMFGMME